MLYRERQVALHSSTIARVVNTVAFAARLTAALSVLSSSFFTLRQVARELNTVPCGLQLLNDLTDALNNSDPWSKRQARIVLAATITLDSSALSATPDRRGHQQMFSCSLRDLFAPQ